VAPMRVASTAESIVPCPDIITTGIVNSPLAAHSLSKDMPSVSGIQMSSRTRSGRLSVANLARRCRILGQPDRVTFVGKNLGQQFANAHFVINDQYLRHTQASGESWLTRRLGVDREASGSMMLTSAPTG
jgi:hypothetical protein